MVFGQFCATEVEEYTFFLNFMNSFNEVYKLKMSNLYSLERKHKKTYKRLYTCIMNSILDLLYLNDNLANLHRSLF